MQVWLGSVSGLAPLVTPAIEFSRGSSCAATAYTNMGDFRTREIETLRWWLAARVPLMQFVYSYDCRWLGCNTREVAVVASVAHVMAQDACAPINHSKMQHTHQHTRVHSTVVCRPGLKVVHGNPVSAAIDTPVIMGVGLEHGKGLADFQRMLLYLVLKVHAFLEQYLSNFVLSTRAVSVYLLSKRDSLARGRALPKAFLHTLHLAVNRLPRLVSGLPADTPRVLMCTLVCARGRGCSDLQLRAELNFLQS